MFNVALLFIIDVDIYTKTRLDGMTITIHI